MHKMKHAALLVLDFINDIVSPNGKFSAAADYVTEYHVIEKANQAIQFARQNNIPVIFVKVGFSAGYSDCPSHSPVFGKAKQNNALRLDSWGTEFSELLAVEPQDTVVTKHRVNAFYETVLEALLSANDVETVLICGVSTNMTVLTTAFEAHDRDYQFIVIEDACGTASLQLQKNTLELLARVAKIMSVAELQMSR
jgi:nicotinamidase-related amidase